jgi:hypothetical protein
MLMHIDCITADEELWRDRYSFRLSRGLKLHPLHEPKWTPSWLGTNLDAEVYEDFIEKPVRKYISSLTLLIYCLQDLHGSGCGTTRRRYHCLHQTYRAENI